MANLLEIRQQLAHAGARRVQLELAAAGAAADLDRLRRETTDDRQALAAAEKAQRAAADAVSAQRAAEPRVQLQLQQAIAAELAPRPEADFAKLDAAFPLVLLPIRIETRFSGANLLIRVYPDEIAAVSHEPELTAEERDLGFAYWNAVWAANKIGRAHV